MSTRLIVGWLGLVGLATPAHSQTLSGDLAKIQGHWWAQVYPPNGAEPVLQFFDIKGEEVVGTNEDPDSRSVGKINLNESAKPRTIDFVGTFANTKPIKDIKMPDMFGIYETDGQTLKIALNSGILNSKRPTQFKVDFRAGISVVTYHRGEPTPEPAAVPRVAMPSAKPAKVEKTASFPGAKVEKIVDRKIHFRAADGRLVITGVRMDRALDASGKPARGLDFIRPGNVVDLTVIYADKPSQLDQIREIRLVGGKAERVVLENIAPTGAMANASPKSNGRVMYLADPDGPGAVYNGAVITKVEPLSVTLDVGGQFITIGRTNANTSATDLQGQALPARQASRVLKEGNRVNVDVRPKRNPNDPNEMPIIRSIRLLQGSLADPR
jgi:uncharacterized protein (TIGR03067 family)